MLHVKFENCRSSCFVDEEYLFSSVDGQCMKHTGGIGMAIAHNGPSG